MDVLNNPTMVTISQYICISNHGVALLKVIQFVNYTSINMGKNQFALRFLLVCGEKLPWLSQVKKVNSGTIQRPGKQ